MSIIYPNSPHFGKIRKVIGAISRPYGTAYFIGDVARFKEAECVSQAGESLSQVRLQKEHTHLYMVLRVSTGFVYDDRTL